MARINITRKVAGSANVDERKWFDSDANQIIDSLQDGTKEINSMSCGLEPQAGSTNISNSSIFVDSNDSNKLKFKDPSGTVSEIGAGSTSLDIVYSCATSVAVGEAVYISAADTVAKASNTTLSTTPCVGIVVNKPTTTSCTVRSVGLISGLVGLSEGNKYYLSVDGGVSVTAPSGTGSIVQLVGVAKNATDLLLTISYSVYENT